MTTLPPLAPPVPPAGASTMPPPDPKPNERDALIKDIILSLTIIGLSIWGIQIAFGKSPTASHWGLFVGALTVAFLSRRMVFEVDTDEVCLKSNPFIRVPPGKDFDPNRPHNMNAYGPGWHICPPWFNFEAVVQCDDTTEIEHKELVFSTDTGTKSVVVNITAVIAAMSRYTVSHWRYMRSEGNEKNSIRILKNLTERFATPWFNNRTQEYVRTPEAGAVFARDAAVFLSEPEQQLYMANIGTYLYGIQFGSVSLPKTVSDAQNTAQAYLAISGALRKMAGPTVSETDLEVLSVALMKNSKTDLVSIPGMTLPTLWAAVGKNPAANPGAPPAPKKRKRKASPTPPTP